MNYTVFIMYYNHINFKYFYLFDFLFIFDIIYNFYNSCRIDFLFLHKAFVILFLKQAFLDDYQIHLAC